MMSFKGQWTPQWTSLCSFQVSTQWMSTKDIRLQLISRWTLNSSNCTSPWLPSKFSSNPDAVPRGVIQDSEAVVSNLPMKQPSGWRQLQPKPCPRPAERQSARSAAKLLTSHWTQWSAPSPCNPHVWSTWRESTLLPIWMLTYLH